MTQTEYLCKSYAPKREVPPEFSTFAKILQYYAEKYPNRRSCGTREFLHNGKRGAYEWYSYVDLYHMVKFLTDYLLGKYQKGDRIGIISANRTEWTVVDLAVTTAGLVLVPIYDTQSSYDIEHVVNDSGVKAIFAAPMLLDRIAHVASKIESIFIFDDRLDDRAIIYYNYKQLTFELPKTVLMQPRSQEQFDEYDKIEGCYDPFPGAKEEKCQNNYSRPVIMLNRADNGEFAYKIPDVGMMKLLKAFKQVPPLSIAHDTFWGLIMKSYNGQVTGKNVVYCAEKIYYQLNQERTAPDDLLTLVYTSGTTGRPKGVMQLQKSLIFASFNIRHSRVFPEHKPVNSLGQPMDHRQEYIISYLPLAHIYMRMIQGAVLMLGAAQGYWQGSTAAMLEDVAMLRITVFPAVPRICQKIVEGVYSKIEQSSAVTRFLFTRCYNSRKAYFEEQRRAYNAENIEVFNGKRQVSQLSKYEYNDTPNLLRRFAYPSWTNIVFNRFPQMLGGRCRLMVSGSAPMCQAHGEFLAICFNMHMFEGWGMSETCAHGAIQSIHTMNFGYIGEFVEPETQIKLRSLPEMGYTVQDKQIIALNGQQINVNNPRGEVLIKGPTVMQGYWNDEQKTHENFDDGWFMTGDVGEYDVVSRQLRLIDRKRGIFKLAYGEYISINQIEDVLSKSRFVEQIYLFASRYQSFTLAVIVPNMSYLKTHVQGVTEQVDTCQPAIQAILNDFKQLGKAAQLKSYEIPKAVVLESEPWTPENGLLTPALKVKRPNCQQKYEPILNDLYNRLAKIDFTNQTAVLGEIIKAMQDGPLEDTKSHASGASGFSGMR